jgi:hypothetical protein
MSRSSFTNQFGLEKYNFYYGGYKTNKAGTGYWVDWSSSESGKPKWLTVPDAENLIIGLSGLEFGSKFVRLDDVVGGGGVNFDNSNLALDIGGGIFGGLRTAVTPGDQWLGLNGKYYSFSRGANRFTGSRSGAFAASNTYKWAGRATVGATAIIGGIAVYNGYQMDGGQFGYNANLAGVSATGGIIGGWAGVQTGAYTCGIVGGLIGGPPGAFIGAVIGGFFGGFWGGRLGSYMGESSVNYYYGR